MSDAMAGQDLAPKAPMDEQLTGEKAATEPRKSESSDDNGDGGVSISEEHHQLSTAKEDKKPVITESGTAFEKENPRPLKSILKKTVGTKAEARQAEAKQMEAKQIEAKQAEAEQTEAAGPSSEQVLHGEHENNNGGGIKLFQGAAERLKASKDDVEVPVQEKQGGVAVPKLVLDTDMGLVTARTNSDDEPVFEPSASGDGDGSPSGKGSPCKGCGLM